MKYVVELAKALSRHPAVHRVDLLTRLIKDPKVDPSYGAPLEPLTEAEGKHGGAYIVRIPCGPVDQYIRWGLGEGWQEGMGGKRTAEGERGEEFPWAASKLVAATGRVMSSCSAS